MMPKCDVSEKKTVYSFKQTSCTILKSCKGSLIMGGYNGNKFPRGTSRMQSHSSWLWNWNFSKQKELNTLIIYIQFRRREIKGSLVTFNVYDGNHACIFISHVDFIQNRGKYRIQSHYWWACNENILTFIGIKMNIFS